MKYKVVFRGKFNLDIDQNDILENLAELFDETAGEIHQRFFSAEHKELILISGLSNEDAKEYQLALQEAGLMADIDLDLDMEDLAILDANFGTPTTKAESLNKTIKHKRTANVEASHTHVEVNLADPLSVENHTDHKKHQNIQKQFLATQEFTLLEEVPDAEAGEKKRIEKLKKQQNKRHHDYVEIIDKDIAVAPPLFNSGVRIGRLRFLYRLTLALALVFLSLNVIPLYLVEYFGSSGFTLSFLLIFLTLMFTLMIISQRFCDIDNLTFGKMLFVAIILGTFIFSVFVNEYYILKTAKITFAKQFLQSNSMSHNFFSMQKVLNAYLLEESQSSLIQQIDAVIKWIVYVVIIGGSVILFTVPGIQSNNQYGAPSTESDFKGVLLFIVSAVVLIYSVSYPYSSKAHRIEHRLYQTHLYEYMGILKPLPNEFDAVYKEYLKKNSTKTP